MNEMPECAQIAVDFNELVDAKTVMLSQTDTRLDARGITVTLYEGMPVRVFEKDVYEDGTMDYLMADGVGIRHDMAAYPFAPHVKWFCRLDADGVRSVE